MAAVAAFPPGPEDALLVAGDVSDDLDVFEAGDSFPRSRSVLVRKATLEGSERWCARVGRFQGGSTNSAIVCGQHAVHCARSGADGVSIPHSDSARLAIDIGFGLTPITSPPNMLPIVC
jgi:hypothetical protein